MPRIIATLQEFDELIARIVLKEGRGTKTQIFDMLNDPEYLLKNFDCIVDGDEIERLEAEASENS